MTRTKNVRNTTKFKRSIKAISPVIATLLMIAIAVVASLVVYAWVTGYIGNTTSTAGKAIQIQSFASQGGNLVIYVQNVGQGDVELNRDQSVYVDSNLVSITSPATLKIPIPVGQTVALLTDEPYTAGTKVSIKVTTTDGTFMTITGTGTSTTNPSPTTPPVNYNVVVTQTANGAIAPGGTTSYAAGATPSFTITPDVGYHIASVTSNAGAQALTSPYAFPALSADATLTATFAANTVNYNVVVTQTANGAIAPGGTTSYAAGATPSFTITPDVGYHIASVTSNAGAQALTSPYAFPALSADATLTATFAANVVTPVTITLRPNAAGTTTDLENSGSGGANWDRVDEATPDTNTYVYGDGSDYYQTDTYNVPDQSLTGTITNVRIYIRASESETRDDVFGRTAIRIGTGAIQNGVQIDLVTTWTDYSTAYATKTGSLGTGAWTWADINNLQIGVGLQSHYSSGGGGTWREARCTQVWVEVTYTP